MDNQLHDLIDIIQFAENATAKIHGLRDKPDIFRVVIEEFRHSKRFIATILLLAEDESSLKIADTSLSSQNIKAMEKAGGALKEHYRIDLGKSSFFRQVVEDDKTIIVTGAEILGELFPRPLATILVKVMGIGNQPSILTPLYQHQNIIGILSLSAPELSDYFISSVKNLAHHITIAMELADEHAERIQAKSALRDSEEKYRTLVEQSLQGHLILQDGRIVFANQAFSAISGYTVEELLAFDLQSVQEIVHSEDRWWVVERFQDRMTGKTLPLRYEYRLLRKDGTVYWVETNTDRINFLGELAMQATFVDITERKNAEEETKRLNVELMEANAVLEEEISDRKQAEEALRKSKERFRALFDSATDGVAIVNPDGSNSYEAPSNHRLLGFEPEESGVTSMFDRIHIEDQERLAEDFAILMQTPFHTTTSSYRALHKDSQWRTIEATGRNLFDDPNIQGIVVNFRDVTERTQAEEALKESEEKFRNIFEYANDEIIYLDASGVVLDVNDRIEDIFGYQREDIIGKNFTEFDFIDKEGMDYLIAQFADAVEGQSIPLTELEIDRKDGDKVSVELSVRMIHVSGEMQGLLVIVRDITERKQAEEETKRLNIELMEANAVLEEEISDRKRAEEALRNSEERFRSIIENADDAITLIDSEGIISYASPSLERIAGYKTSRLIGTSFRDYMHPDDFTLMEGNLANILSSPGHAESIAMRLKRKDGSWCWVEGVGKNFLNDRCVQAIVCNYRDITERKYAEEALRNSEAHWRALFETAPNIIMSVDREGVIWSINRIVTGLTKEQVIGSSIYDFAGLEFHNIIRQSIERVLQTGNAGTYEAKGTGPDGSISWYETHIGPVEQDGEVVALTLITTDITDRKNSEEEILLRNQELAAINDIAQTISQSLALDEILNNALNKTLDILNTKYGAIGFMDDETESLMIRTARGTNDDVVNALSPIKLGEVDKSLWMQLKEPLFIESLEEWVKMVSAESLKTALEQPIESAMFVPLSSKGEVIGLICAFTGVGRVFTPEEKDLLITIGHQISTAIENAQLLEEVSRAEALEELDKLRTALLASVSHELRTPLTSIKGLASTLTQPDVDWDSETQQDFLRIIDRESDILTHIVEDLMQMSQMEAGIMTMEKTGSNIGFIINQLVDKLSDLTAAHEFKIVISADTAPIYADEIRIGEVVTNLVANATAYSEPGTQITLRTDEIDGQVVVSVTDQGIGIPPEHVDKVFDRFYRLESGIARRRGGTGLGLSICKGIVENHDGIIQVKSVSGTGSTFSFSLPITENTEVTSSEYTV